ncbi:hypothetical protein BH09VER1_BH09VER1_37500 [soil metagenome]
MTKHLLGFGASSMQGVGDTQGGFLSRLASRCLATGTHQVTNAGVGGNTTRDMLGRLPTLNLPPDDLIVLLGCNDLPRAHDPSPENRVPLSEYRANLTTLLAALKGQRNLFVSSFLPSEPLTGVSLETFESYMAAATQIARELDYEIWDLFAETKHGAETYLAPDGLHFNDAGHAFLAGRIGAWLLQSPSAPAQV